MKTHCFTKSYKIQRKEKKHFTKYITDILVSLFLMISSVLSIPVYAEGTALITNGSHQALADKALQYVNLNGYVYDESVRFGPTHFDCSGFVDVMNELAGFGSQPHSERWTTESWSAALSASGIPYDERTGSSEAQTAAALSTVPANAGDIILFYRGAVSVHIGIMTGTNHMVNAHYGGIRHNALKADGSGLRVYTAGGSKGYTKARIYHFPTTFTAKIDLQKSSSDSTITDGNNAYSLINAVYGVYCGDSEVGTITTDSEGKGSWEGSVPSGTSTLHVKEIEASSNYLLDEDTHEAALDADHHGSIQVSEVPVTGELSLQIVKKNSDESNYTARLDHAEFKVSFYAQNPVLAIDTSNLKYQWTIQTLEENGQYIARLDADHLVSGDAFPEKIPLGIFTIEETKAPEGFTKDYSVVNVNGTEVASDNGICVLPAVNDSGTAHITLGNTYIYREKEIRGGFEFRKVNADHTYAQSMNGAFALVNKNNYAVSVNHQTFAPNETILTFETDNNGLYTSAKDLLPFGSYEIREVRAPKGFYTSDSSAEINISYSGQIAESSLADHEIHYVLNKVDEAGNPYMNAHLILFEKDNPENVIIDYISDGSDKEVGNLLEEGKTYVFRELDTKETDVYIAKEMTFTVSHLTEDGNKTQLISLTNQHVDLNIAKVDENGNYVPGAVLEVYDVSDPSERLVQRFTSGSQPLVLNSLKRGRKYQLREVETPDGHYNAGAVDFETDEIVPDVPLTITMTDHTIHVQIAKVDDAGNPVSDAYLQLFDADTDELVAEYITKDAPIDVEPSLLKAGHSYRVHENRAPNGYYPAENDAVFTLEQVREDDTPVIVTMVDYPITMSIAKKDPSGNYVKGAVLRLTDTTEHTEIGTWQSAEDDIQVDSKLLKAGHSYTLEEVSVPDGYYRSDPVTMNLPEKSAQAYHAEIVMEDIPISYQILKQDTDGHPLADITLSVLDADNQSEVISFRTRPDIPQQVGQYLVEGHSYILRENEVINGFYKSCDITFTVLSENRGKNIVITMEDAPINIAIRKTDENDVLLNDAKMVLKDENGNIIDKWTTVQEEHQIGSLVHAGNTYTVEESEVVEGYYKAVAQTFTVSEYQKTNEPIVLTMVDEGTHYEVLKEDENGRSVKGVHLKLYDITNPSEKTEVALPNDGITKEKPMKLDCLLAASHRYELVEEEWVNGVHRAESVSFNVSAYAPHKTVVVQMTDLTNHIGFRKTDPEGNNIAGAKMEILKSEVNEDGTLKLDENGNAIAETDENGNPVIVATFTTAESDTDLSDMVKGDCYYIMREAEAPFGFEKAEDIVFKAYGDAYEHQLIRMSDERRKIRIVVDKFDASSSDKKISDALFGLYDENMNPYLDMEGKECTTYTDEEGSIHWVVPYRAKTIYLKELSAPDGYVLKTDVLSHEIKEEDFEENAEIVFHVENARKPVPPDTGDVMHQNLLWILFAGGMALLVVLAGIRIHFNPHKN